MNLQLSIGNLATLMLLIKTLLLYVNNNISKSKLFTGNHYKRRRGNDQLRKKAFSKESLYSNINIVIFFFFLALFSIIESRTTFASKVMPSKFQYDVVAEVVTDGNVTFSKYKSRNSGMTVCIAQVNGPLVGGYLTFGKF